MLHTGALGERRYSSCSFLTSALQGGWVVSITPRPRFTPGERAPPGTHCTGGWVGPRADLDAESRGKILCLCRGSNPGRPVRSQTLHWLSYPAHLPAKEVRKFVTDDGQKIQIYFHCILFNASFFVTKIMLHLCMYKSTLETRDC
jgi:hypothetical protein